MEKLKDLTVVVIAHDEANNLRQLLPLLEFAGRVIVIDNNSTDETKAVTQAAKASYFLCEETSFAKVRDYALGYVKTKWIFYLDADERVTPALAKEIAEKMKENQCAALQMRRENFCYGEKLMHGGWENDKVTRVFRLDNFKSWRGEIHESPNYKGETCFLSEALLHFTHKDTASNLRKSAAWTIKEAKLLAAAKTTPLVTKKTIWRKGLMEFYRRYYRDNGRKDGMTGFVESLVQAMNRMFVYIQVWELQQKPTIADKYAKQEKYLDQAWQKEK